MWELPTDEERATAESLVRRFQRTVLAKAEAHGWKLDNTSDLARVFRVPGTLNWKNAEHPVPVKIVSCSSERRFDPVDFAPHLAPDAKLPQLDAELFSPSGDSGSALSDDVVVARALTANDLGKFARLWAGDSNDFGGDASAGDMSCCDTLAFWANRDPLQMDRLFRRSGRNREKWDEIHYANGETYGQHTIAEAIARTARGYSTSYSALARPVSGEGDETCDAFVDAAEPAFASPQDEIADLRRALAAERAKNAVLTRDAGRLDQENRSLRDENQRLQMVHSKQWRVITNQRLKGVGHTAVKIHAEYTSALEHAKGENGWVPMTIGSDYGIATGAGKSAKRAGSDLQKLVDWNLAEKRTETVQLTDGPDAGQLRTRMYVRIKDPNGFLDDLAHLDPQQPSWGGKRVPRCRDHPHAEVIRTTAYMCKECGQIIAGPTEQAFPPEGQDVPSEMAAAPKTCPNDASGEEAAPEALTDLALEDPPDGTRCPSADFPSSAVDIRTLDGQLDGSGASPPDALGPAPPSIGNPLHDFARQLFGGHFIEDAPA